MSTLFLSLISIGVIVSAFVLCTAAMAKNTPSSTGAVNVPHLLDSIAGAENTKQWEIGPGGERSIYQISPAVWQTHSDLPFEQASRIGEKSQDRAWNVAHKHIDWIRARLYLLELDDTPYSIALVWHAGYGRCMAKKIRAIDREYAQRVENIYNDK